MEAPSSMRQGSSRIDRRKGGASSRSGGLPWGGRPMTSAPDEVDLPLDVLERLDRVCERFEDHWRAGGVPRILDYLGGFDGAERRLLFREVLHADAELRRGGGPAPPPPPDRPPR